VWVVLFGTLYQQVENYLIGPRITARTVAVHPAVAVGAVIAGAELFGPMGALVSIPVVAAVQAVIETYGHGYDLVEEESASDTAAEAAVPTGPTAGWPADGTPVAPASDT
jgi:predicted PurR-regulated permease PerM